MAKHRIRRWFQFGILDLLILTTVVAVAVSLSRPLQAKVNRAPPWIVGGWSDGSLSLLLMPDGYYLYDAPHEGTGWTFSPSSAAENAFVLECGKLRFVIRSEGGSEAVELLKEDGSVHLRLRQNLHLEGSMCDRTPHGTWRGFHAGAPQEPARFLLEYRFGELVDCHDREAMARSLSIGSSG